MRLDVFASRMFPSRSSHQHGPPLLGRVEVPALPRRQSSYAVLRLPLPLRPPLRSSLAYGLPLVFFSGGGGGDPRFLGRPLARVPRFLTPSLAPASRPTCEAGAAAFELPGSLGSGYMHISWPTHAAHMLACLRINQSITGLAARLATGLPGSALAGRDSPPLDDKHDFRSSTLSFLRDQPYLVASR